MHKTFVVLFLFMWQFNEDNCIKNNMRIFGGYYVSIERAPYYVQLLIKDEYLCGGSILRQEMILTACHCVLNDGPFSVIAGSDHLLEGTIIGVKNVVKHPGYDQKGRNNDIALLILKTPLKYSNKIQPIKIPNYMTQPLAEGTQVFVVGLGMMKGMEWPTYLQGIELPVIEKMDCDTFLVTHGALQLRTQFCLGDMEADDNYNTCQGDSGGPATYNGIQYGITSWGIKCGEQGYPGVFTNLMRLNAWVQFKAAKMGFPLP